MEPVITIPFSEYKELKDFQKRNMIEIVIHDSHYSFGERNFKINWQYFTDRDLPINFIQDLNFKLKEIERLIAEQQREAKLLAEEREKQQRVPKWILRIFNRKAN